MKSSYLLLFVLVISASCGSRTPLEQFDGFRFGETRHEAAQTAKANKIAMNFRHLSYWQQYGGVSAHIQLVFGKKDGRLFAFDIKGLPCRKPEDARTVVFKWKDYFETVLGPASGSVTSHPNFDVVNYQWKFKNATIYLGTKIINFQTLPRMLVIENRN